MTDSQPVQRIRHLAVVIPACNEELTMQCCLDSVDAARCELPKAVSTSVVVAADSCTDRTESTALNTLSRRRDDQVLRLSVRSAGAARRIATNAALDRLDLPLEEVWIASTDADTTVDFDWLTIQLRLARAGAVGVSGIVDLSGHGSIDASLRRSFEYSYVTSIDGTHPHVHGANLGFRADAYRAVGGWNAILTGEDHDLWNRLQRHGPIVSTTELCVHTSPRTTGRAPDGFARDLRLLTATADATVA